MKRKNVKVGQLVKVKKSTIRNHDRIGMFGEVTEVEDVDYDGELTVRLEFNEKNCYGVCCGWFNHKDVKLVKDVGELGD